MKRATKYAIKRVPPSRVPPAHRRTGTHINLTPFVFIGFCAVIGAITGHVLIGLAIGLGIVFTASLIQ